MADPASPAGAASLRLEVGGDRLATLAFDSPGRKVNVFSRAVFEELERTIDELARRDDVGCLVLLSGKEGNFIAVKGAVLTAMTLLTKDFL